MLVVTAPAGFCAVGAARLPALNATCDHDSDCGAGSRCVREAKALLLSPGQAPTREQRFVLDAGNWSQALELFVAAPSAGRSSPHASELRHALFSSGGGGGVLATAQLRVTVAARASPSLKVLVEEVVVPAGGVASYGVCLWSLPAAPVRVFVSLAISGGAALLHQGQALAAGERLVLTFDASNWADPKQVLVAAEHQHGMSISHQHGMSISHQHGMSISHRIEGAAEEARVAVRVVGAAESLVRLSARHVTVAEGGQMAAVSVRLGSRPRPRQPSLTVVGRTSAAKYCARAGIAHKPSSALLCADRGDCAPNHECVDRARVALSTTRLVFAGERWYVPQLLLVSAVDDDSVEGDSGSSVVLTALGAEGALQTGGGGGARGPRQGQ